MLTAPFSCMPKLKTPTQKEIVRAATNDPSLSTASFTLGDRTFTIVDLPYDDYIKFFAYLQPLIEKFAGAVTGIAFTTAQADDLSVSGLIKYCSESLPEMVRMMCSQTDPTVTVEDVKKMVRSPFKLAAIVMEQVKANKVIEDMTDFFEQIVPLLKRSE